MTFFPRVVSVEDNESSTRFRLVPDDDGGGEIVVEAGPPLMFGGRVEEPTSRLGTFTVDVTVDELVAAGVDPKRAAEGLRVVRQG